MKAMNCFTRVRARVSQWRIDAPCARPRGGATHIGEIRLRAHMHILKTTSIHVSAATGPALKRPCGPRSAAVSVRDCRA
jgi:hypothetical protein